MTPDDTAVLSWLLVILVAAFVLTAVYAIYLAFVAAAWGRVAASARAVDDSWRSARRRRDDAEGPTP